MNVECAFASTPEVMALRDWGNGRAPVNSEESDSIEYGRIISTWWVHYSNKQLAVTGIRDVFRRIAANKKAEVAFCIRARAAWHPAGPIVGAALVRRTWANNLFLDNLATHPALLAEGSDLKLKGVGSALLYYVSRIGLLLKAHRLWGEATANSCNFYSHVLEQGVSDLILEDHEIMVKFVESYERMHNLRRRSEESILMPEVVGA